MSAAIDTDLRRSRSQATAEARVADAQPAFGSVPQLSTLQWRLLNEFQRDFPIEPQPFAAIANQLGVSEDEVIDNLHALDDLGLLSRVGPVFSPSTVGVSTLAAMAVPAHRLDEVAQLVNGYPQVNHNYEREHAYNLWFVLTAANADCLAAVLREIAQRSGLEVMNLPLEHSYHIDLGFPLW